MSFGFTVMRPTQTCTPFANGTSVETTAHTPRMSNTSTDGLLRPARATSPLSKILSNRFALSELTDAGEINVATKPPSPDGLRRDMAFNSPTVACRSSDKPQIVPPGLNQKRLQATWDRLPSLLRAISEVRAFRLRSRQILPMNGAASGSFLACSRFSQAPR